MRDDTWQAQAWDHRTRLGQFTDLATDDRSETVRGALEEIRVALDGWTELTDDERDARWTPVQERHGETVLSMSAAEIDALDDDGRIALLSAMTLTAATRQRLAAAAGIEPVSAVDAPTPAAPAAEAAAPDAGDLTTVTEPETTEPVVLHATPEELAAIAPVTTEPTEPTEVPVVTAATEYTDDRWHAIVFVEGVRTNDGRMATPGGISTRPLPLPLQYTTETTYGHEGAELGGSIESLMRDPNLAQQLSDGGFVSLADGAMLLVAEGSYVPTPEGEALQNLVNTQSLRFVSADLEILEAEEALSPGGDPDNWSDYILIVTRGNVMGATVCPFPAFQQCVIAPMSMDLFEAATQGMDAASTEPVEPVAAPVAVAAAGGPAIPPATWFRDPQFGSTDREDVRLVEDPDFPGKFYCPNTITDDGRLFGHGAAWHREHIGYGGRRVLPPHSQADYAYFTTGTIVVDLGDDRTDVIRCGVITMDTGHNPTTGANASAAATKRHYDDTGTVIADIEIGEDEHGIWYSGALRADVPDDKLRAFRAAAVSGDWRPINSASEMVGLLAVNVPGFPLPRPRRSYRVENDTEVELALVAAGFVPPRDPMHDAIHREVQMQLAPLRAALDKLAPLALAAQSSRLDG